MKKKTLLFVEKLHELLNKLENKVDTMPYQGDSCNKSQKICLQISINDLRAHINGIEDEDLEPSKDYQYETSNIKSNRNQS